MFRLESWLIPFLLTSNWNLKGCTDNCNIKNVTGLQDIPTDMPIKINKILNFYRTHQIVVSQQCRSYLLVSTITICYVKEYYFSTLAVLVQVLSQYKYQQTSSSSTSSTSSTITAYIYYYSSSSRSYNSNGRCDVSVYYYYYQQYQ